VNNSNLGHIFAVSEILRRKLQKSLFFTPHCHLMALLELIPWGLAYEIRYHNLQSLCYLMVKTACSYV